MYEPVNVILVLMGKQPSLGQACLSDQCDQSSLLAGSKKVRRGRLRQRIYQECERGIEKSVPRITLWHCEACRVMTNRDPL